MYVYDERWINVRRKRLDEKEFFHCFFICIFIWDEFGVIVRRPEKKRRGEKEKEKKKRKVERKEEERKDNK